MTALVNSVKFPLKLALIAPVVDNTLPNTSLELTNNLFSAPTATAVPNMLFLVLNF